jgi:hypothetical protein
MIFAQVCCTTMTVRGAAAAQESIEHPAELLTRNPRLPRDDAPVIDHSVGKINGVRFDRSTGI